MDNTQNRHSSDVFFFMSIIFPLIVSYGLMISLFSIPKNPGDSGFNYKINNYTTITVSPTDCVRFGRGMQSSIHYWENGVQKEALASAFNLDTHPSVQACMDGLTSLAKSKQRGPIPMKADDNLFKDGVSSRVEFDNKDNAPHFTTYYLNGQKVNSITLPIAACANPQFEGTVTLAYRGNTFRNDSLNTIEQESTFKETIINACDNLAR